MSQKNSQDYTIFDKILDGSLPCDKVFENQHVLAFKDINPASDVHVLVIPKQRIKSFNDLKDGNAEYLGIYLQSISYVASLLGLADDGYRVVFNEGTHGQKTVDYLHAHILGARQMKWPPG